MNEYTLIGKTMSTPFSKSQVEEMAEHYITKLSNNNIEHKLEKEKFFQFIHENHDEKTATDLVHYFNEHMFSTVEKKCIYHHDTSLHIKNAPKMSSSILIVLSVVYLMLIGVAFFATYEALKNLFN